ncbi:hypothetical protein [Leptospira borgpetersenii]|uniref:Uncharacterized protein n=1 Tax=Leptospira borgpetersenii serovar Javanica str. UI 09931 TaxID=1049767 RepID=A0AAV3J4U0_LEPBO|nr:hypothetical protein [Leptospira borgpetersenii]EMN59726.1 hypothetical protein LEP1GSC090_2720 [Leptospira borgpetersenii serovar Javanica str. MK146]EPG55926.1 hypothetical protein LEP1GSC103_0663 [Leptospira borgpetersenii serovar Javanica str. UI 09931]MDQ7245912.1 hypothetical protein [Leptospira borgpetersenii]PTM48113.1 hypothetical protein CLV95_10910 [Leptospira borgpetersenii serovar Javanica]GIM19654.1 hypothetical protein KHM09_21050 [Leptospira borgpetersenii]
MDKIYDNSKNTVVILDPSPVDVSAGLSIDGDFFSAEKENKDEVTTRRGTKDESYSSNSIHDSSRIVTLKYLPSALAVPYLQNLRESKKDFGFLFSSDSEPKYKLTASRCVFMEEPKTTINGKTGFNDYEFKVRLLDSVQKFS